MGLLDDAIREHLELKRRHGADPGEIAHQERAALEPVFPDEASEQDGAEPLAEDESAPADGLAAQVEEPGVDGALEEPAQPAPNGAEPPDGGEDLGTQPASGTADALGDFSQTGQETAELDMSTVLDDDADGTAAPGEIVAAPPRQRGERSAAAHAGEDSFEWQAPGSDGEQLSGDIPGQERLSFE